METEPMWTDQPCSRCDAVVEVHSTESWNGLCPDCDESLDSAPH